MQASEQSEGYYPSSGCFHFFFLHGNKEARSSVVGEVGAGGTGNLGREDKNLSSR